MSDEITEQQAREAVMRIWRTADAATEVSVETAVSMYGSGNAEIAAERARQDWVLAVTWAEQELSRRDVDEATGDPIGWTIVAIGNEGSVLCQSPTGARRRYWLHDRDAERADREKPIDAEWLGSIGAYRESDYGGDEGYYTIDIDADEWLSICEEGYVTTIVIGDGRKQLSRKFETRGQLLDLLAALKGGAS